MQRTDLMDTSEWAHRELVNRLRQLTPEERFQMTIDCVDMGREMHALAMKRLADERAKKK
ncbi:MAG: hypothetical protein ACAH95_12980 [Fimbriimonas sp.]